MGFSVSETAAGQLPLSRSCAARRPIIHPPSERMWCTPPLDAPRGADFSPSHGHDLDFLWSGRRCERTTDFEPATLTLARLFGTTLPPATLYIHQCFTGLLTYRSRP